MGSRIREEIVNYTLSQLKEVLTEYSESERGRIAEFVVEAIIEDRFDTNLIGEELLKKIKKYSKFFGFLINRVSLEYILLSYKNGDIKEGFDTKLEKLKKISVKFEETFEIIVWKTKSVITADSFFAYPSNSIVNSFEIMRDENESVEFINLYKGIPIVSYGKVVHIEDNKVAFKIENPLHQIAMKLEGKAYMLKNEYITRYVKADVVYTNFINNTVVLENFVYLLDMPAAQREYIRVHPNILARVVFKKDSKIPIEGKLYDLSQNGLGVISEYNQGISNNEEVFISFSLNDKDNLEIRGEIVNILEYNGAYRYCIKIYPDDEQTIKVKEYIENRKEEILEDLRRELNEYFH